MRRPILQRSWRVAMYSQGMVGFGHIRRNASIAQALRRSELRPAIAMIAEAWQAGALPLPEGVDCVTLPSIRRDADGGLDSRILEVSHRDVVALRASVIRSVINAFDPDLFLVDQWPLGAAGELVPALWQMRRRGRTRCVLGLRDVLYDRDTTSRLWSTPENLEAIRDWYDAVWIYGDPDIYDAVHEYELPDAVVAKTSYTGYIDQRPRLDSLRGSADARLEGIPDGRFVLCAVGGGHDGAALVEAFARAELPPGMAGVVVNGPLMGASDRRRARRIAQQRPDLTLLDFVEDTTPLVARAARVIAMGGYNTVCEVLSFEKHALIVPRVQPEPEQWVRAERMRAAGLLHVLHPNRLTAHALSEWLARDLGAPPHARRAVDMGALRRLPQLAAELLQRRRTATALKARLAAAAGARP
ncbi:MAG TPA: glycosyltransferase [Gemmatimonadales bacterium]|nr:glycosyltransferase [Gemmatimonadales bacterium]